MTAIQSETSFRGHVCAGSERSFVVGACDPVASCVLGRPVGPSMVNRRTIAKCLRFQVHH